MITHANILYIFYFRKDSSHLGQTWKGGVPIEVISSAYKPIIMKIQSMCGGKPELRLANKKAVGTSESCAV